MAVIMGVFRPNVHCRGTLDTPGSCRHVLADMPASTDLEVFGPRDAPFVKEVLPQEIVSGKALRSASLVPRAPAHADDVD